MNGTIKYIICEEIIKIFCKEALKNKSSNGHIETLALVTGYWDGTSLIADGLIFPKQSGTSTEVEDLGNSHLQTNFFCHLTIILLLNRCEIPQFTGS